VRELFWPKAETCGVPEQVQYYSPFNLESDSKLNGVLDNVLLFV